MVSAANWSEKTVQEQIVPYCSTGFARQILHWDRTNRFCSRCGGPMEPETERRVKTCPQCHRTNFSRISPAIIVAVVKANKLLLARAHRHPPGLYSVIAGFIEPGETLEDCVRREVKEETGVDVKEIREKIILFLLL